MADVIAQITILGTRPLLWHHFGPDAIPLEAREKTGKAGNDPSEWKRTALITKAGQLYLEPAYIFAAVRDGAMHAPRGRGTYQSYVQATLEVMDDQILLNRSLPNVVQPLNPQSPKPVYIDVRSVRNPTTRAMNIRYRLATTQGWSTSFKLRWDNALIGEDQMKAILNSAGKFSGLGSGRKLGLGRFVVTDFSILSPEKVDAQNPTTAGDLDKHTTKRVAKRSSRLRSM